MQICKNDKRKEENRRREILSLLNNDLTKSHIYIYFNTLFRFIHVYLSCTLIALIDLMLLLL